LSLLKRGLFLEAHDALIQPTNRLLQRGHSSHERPERDAHVVEICPHKIKQIGYRLESSIDPPLESAGNLAGSDRPGSPKCSYCTKGKHLECSCRIRTLWQPTGALS